MPRPRDHPPDVPAHGDRAAVSVSFDQLRCERCGVTSNPPHDAVGDFPRLGDADPRGRLSCTDCIAEHYADRTGLSKRLARVLALELAGYSHAQIGRSEGRSVTRIRRWAKRIRDEHGRAGEREAVAGLLEYL